MKRLPMVEDEEPAQTPVRYAGPIQVQTDIATRQVAMVLFQLLPKVAMRNEELLHTISDIIVEKMDAYYRQAQIVAVCKPSGTA
ncbi:hypothetical protein [Methylobacterium bullatum]|uniref:Uncharacterized protein n=1 Tax=Methylobacterium bullatum TaxID=570505 RepID=A0A679JF95_9HYPH|nr:hypothetical protein MBLL_00681 [Methylobacterium bullatum]